MSRRFLSQPRATRPSITPSVALSTLLLCCPSYLFSSISYAETQDNLTTQLSKLGYEQAETVERIPNYRVDGWNYLDDRHIVIYAGPSQRFLITMLINCPDLSSAERIGFTSTTRNLTKFDKLIVRGAGGIVQNCPISELRILNKSPLK